MNPLYARARQLFTAGALTAAFAACGAPPERTAEGGLILSLAAAPADAGCLHVSVAGSRTVQGQFQLVVGSAATFTMAKLPIGVARVSAEAYTQACAEVTPGSIPTYVTDVAVPVRIDAQQVSQVLLKLLRNGRLGVAVAFEAPPWVDESRAAVDIAVIGDTPYGAPQVADLPNFVSFINADPTVSLVVHVGDIKNGSSRCDTSYFNYVAGEFAKLNDPFILTPGDNEWTDCHRANNGAYDPIECLQTLRSVFYPMPGLAGGGGEKQVLTQATIAGHEAFVENQAWVQAGVAFSVVHVVGSNNGLAPWFGDNMMGKADDPARRTAEVAAREQAALQFIDETFALAEATDAAGVAITMQADTWEARAVAAGTGFEGFTKIVRHLADKARTFAKPVLLIQGDSHRYKVDAPLAMGDPIHGVAVPVPNLMRVIVEGENTSEFLKLHVDPAAPEVFSWQRVTR